VPSGSMRITNSPSSRVHELGLALPTPPTPLGAYIESSDAVHLLFLSGGLDDNFSVEQGREAAFMASLNALSVAKEHLGDMDRLKKLVKLTVLIATTEQFTEHASVADGASNLFVQIFGTKAGHVQLVYEVQSLRVGAPLHFFKSSLFPASGYSSPLPEKTITPIK